MTQSTTKISRLRISGFRAYLDEVTFELKGGKSLAVFAPNGHGKSSLVDALEFLLSDEGTLAKLGVRKSSNQAGIEALPHILAAERKQEAFVEVSFTEPQSAAGKRLATGKDRPMPALVSEVKRQLRVHPIIRGHELRHFVEQETAEERYKSIAGWLELAPLAGAQKNLRELRKQVKAASEDKSAIKAVNKQLSTATKQAVTEWTDDAVRAYLTALLAGLDPTLSPQSLAADDPSIISLFQRAKAEESRLGLDSLRQLRGTIDSLYEVCRDEEGIPEPPRGLVMSLIKAYADLLEANRVEAELRARTAEAVFARLWEVAAPLFLDETVAPEFCPICTTPIRLSTAGGVAAIREHLEQRSAELASYAVARKRVTEATRASEKAKIELLASLQSFSTLLSGSFPDAARAVTDFAKELDDTESGPLPSHDHMVAALSVCSEQIDSQLRQILEQQGETSALALKAQVIRLREIDAEREEAEAVTLQISLLSQSLTSQAQLVSELIRQKIQNLLDRLRVPVNTIYRSIQGHDAASIRIDLPPEDDMNQQRLSLLIDFAENREAVQPSGYLSDSQVHSLALALRLVAIRAFNSTAPFVVLDDVVTSYDADHRRSLAAMFSKEFSEMQFIVVTHDERFFIYLKDQLASVPWLFKRIYRLDRDFGPRFVDHAVTEDIILARWAEGKSAANEMRQAEEEWLLRICREFTASVKIRPAERAYSYERSELAGALASSLKDFGLSAPAVPGVQNKFLNSLQMGTIENFGSHFQDDPNAASSIGDEKTRWAEFSAFRDYFRCSQCGRDRFKRPLGLKKPVCAADGCEAQFAFSVPTPSDPQA